MCTIAEILEYTNRLQQAQHYLSLSRTELATAKQNAETTIANTEKELKDIGSTINLVSRLPGGIRRAEAMMEEREQVERRLEKERKKFESEIKAIKNTVRAREMQVEHMQWTLDISRGRI